MSKKIIKPIVMFLVFILAVIAFSFFTNKSNEDMTTTMASPTLPVMSFTYHDMEINALYGYVDTMDINAVRGNITPVLEDRILTMKLATYGMPIEKISYEIRSIDGERLMAGNSVETTESGDNLWASIKLENILSKGEEYMLMFTVNNGEKNIYYYTRLMQTDDSETDVCLDFAKEFHDKTFDKEEDGTYFAKYVDMATGDATTFHYVDLTCTARQIMWRGFDCTPISDLEIDIDEITENYNSITFRYVMTSVSESGEIDYYNVEEYFRLRQGSTQMFVLDYERTTTQIFNGENSFLKDGSAISLGITGEDVNYVTNDGGTVIAFALEGDLWSYDISANLLTKVFSFRGMEGIERRENLNQHKVRVMRVDEAGSIDYVVYGYMTRGDHEGQVGVGIYHLDGLSHTVEEEAFIPTNTCASVLETQLGQLMYVNDAGKAYLTLGGKLYEVDLTQKTKRVVVATLKEGSYTASQSNRYFAYVESDSINNSASMKFMDLLTGTTTTISGSEGELVKPLAFVGDDFIYGIANASDVFVDAAGTTTFPMKAVRIVSASSPVEEVLKEYAPNGSFVGSIAVDTYIIKINLIQSNGSFYVSSGTDQIMNREADKGQTVYLYAAAIDEKETVYSIAFALKHGSGNTKLLQPKTVIASMDTTVNIERSEEQERYYVFVKGKAIYSSDSISAAILYANQRNAVVVDEEQHYVWKRSRAIYKDPIGYLNCTDADNASNSIAKCISAMLVKEKASVSVGDMISQGHTPFEVLELTIKDKSVLDLTHCTVDEMLYYVNQGTPVFAMTGSDTAILLTGYTSSRIFYWDPNSKTTLSMGLEEANQMFYNAGNIFFALSEE